MRRRAVLGRRGGLRGLALCLRPRSWPVPGRAGPTDETRLPAEAIAIVMAVDVSGSMDDEGGLGRGQPPITRLEAAQRAFKLFVFGGEAPDGTKFEPRPSDQIGLVTFAAIPEVACPLTLNHSRCCSRRWMN